MKALLVEDDELFAEIVVRLLGQYGIDCDVSKSGKNAMEHLESGLEYDLILADLKLPDITGNELIKRIRQSTQKHKDLPIIVISGLGDDKLELALGNGADDAIKKPYKKSDFLARIRAVFRRSRGFTKDLISIGNGEIELDLRRRVIRANGRDMKLTGKEYELLHLFILNKDCVLDKNYILETLYARKLHTPKLKIIDVLVCKIRQLLKKKYGVEREYIQTDWSIGYKFVDPTHDSENKKFCDNIEKYMKNNNLSEDYVQTKNYTEDLDWKVI